MVAATPAYPADVAIVQRYAHAAGVAMLLSIIFGFLGEMYLPGKIIVSYLVEGFCDVALCGVLLHSSQARRPASRAAQRVLRHRVDGDVCDRAIELIRRVARAA